MGVGDMEEGWGGQSEVDPQTEGNLILDQH